jgi:hypothetical protein
MARVDDGAVDSVDTLFNAAGDTTGVAYAPDEDASPPFSEPVAPAASPTHRLFRRSRPRRDANRRSVRHADSV